MVGRVLLGHGLWKGIMAQLKHGAGERKGERAVPSP